MGTLRSLSACDLESHLHLRPKEVCVTVERDVRRVFVVVARVEVRVTQGNRRTWIQYTGEHQIEFATQVLRCSWRRRVVGLQRHTVGSGRLIEEEVVVPEQGFEAWPDVGHELEVHVVDVSATEQIHEAQVLVSQWEQVIEAIIAAIGGEVIATRGPVVPHPNSWIPFATASAQ